MPTLDWLKKEFSYGYESGDVLAFRSDPVREKEEAAIGGNYRRVFCECFLPFSMPFSNVMELGPGKGSWSRAILEYIPWGILHTVDFQDVSPWLQPERHGGRVICHQVKDNSFSTLPESFFDIFWSFGVLCHVNKSDIKTILTNSLSRMRPGSVAIHQYGDWDKLESYGWQKGGVPLEFKNMPDDQIWWPRNSRNEMSAIARESGWEVVVDDLGILERDAIMILRRP